jgi:zinc-binding alcohol dehydrogenase family protein
LREVATTRSPRASAARTSSLPKPWDVPVMNQTSGREGVGGAIRGRKPEAAIRQTECRFAAENEAGNTSRAGGPGSLPRSGSGSLLVVGGAGGFGSVAIQLARQLTQLEIIARASRPDTQDWCHQMGAHHVVDHRQPLGAQVRVLVPGGVNYVLALTKVEGHYDEIIEAMAPQSAMALIENPARPFEITKLKPKSIALHWEFIFTRSRFQTADMGEQGRLLTETGKLMDAGRIRTPLLSNVGAISAENMRKAHALVEGGRTIGKIVLAGF